MARVTQLSVCLENKPGMAAKLGEVLRRAKVNIVAISVVDSTDTGVVRLIVDNTARAGMALTRAGMKPTRQAVLALDLPNEPGALAEAGAKLAKAGVNINYLYGSAPRRLGEAMIVMGVDNIRKATAVT